MVKRKKIQIIVFLSVGLMCLDGRLGRLEAREFLSPEWDLETSAGVNQRFDDNISYKDTGELSDSITEPYVSAILKSEEKSRLIQLNGSLYYPYFYQHDELSHLKVSLGGEYQKELSKYESIRVVEKFDHTEEPSDFISNFGRTIERAEYNHNLLTFSYTRELSRRDSLRLEAFSEWNDFSVDVIRDSGWHGAEIEWARSISSDLELYTGGGFDVRHFVDSEAAERFDIFGGLRKDFTHQTRLDLKAGADLIDDFQGDSLGEPFWIASLETNWDERTRSTVYYSQRHQSNPFVEDIFDAWEIRGTYERSLSPKADLRMEIFYGQGEYLERSRDDDFAGVSVGLKYELKKDVALELSVTHTDLSSSEEGEDYSKNTVQAGLKMRI
jgi:hypothetical protein